MCVLSLHTMPIIALIFGVCLGKFTREYITHKQQMERLQILSSQSIPGAYLEWLTAD